MQIRNMKQRSVNVHDFAMVPRADIPRAAFRQQHTVKQAFSAGYLVPIMVEEVLPGDAWNVSVTCVARTAVPIVPILDNWHLETFFFFVPNRLVWTNWQKFMGEQANPGDSISYTVPQCTSPVGGFAVSSIADYMGLPTVGQVAGANTVSVNALPLRMYNLIWQTWFRDQNLQNSTLLPVNTGDGPDTFAGTYALQRRGKRHDYFTSALPFVQKGTSVSLPLGTVAPVRTASTAQSTGVQQPVFFHNTATGAIAGSFTMAHVNPTGLHTTTTATGATTSPVYPANLFADLSAATAATINQLRQSFQIQKLLERDARGGTRYQELIRAHFGVVLPEKQWRPEYLGGGHMPVNINAVPQTSATGLTGGTTPAGTLVASGSIQGTNGFSYSALEHGFIIGLVNVRADLTYQQGMRRQWSRSTRYDYYFPVFAMLGEQPVYNREIYADGSANDALVFGYQERWAEYRYNPSRIAGLFRSTAAGTIDYWHSAQRFTTLPTLNSTFIEDQSDTVLQRNFAGGALTANQQFLCDFFFDGQVARAMPMYSVPGLVDHF